MRLTSDIIDRDTLEQAAITTRREHGQDIYLHEIAATRGRSKRHSITFYAYSISGNRRTNRGDGEMAASWSAYGYLIAELFKIDPEAKIGQYDNPHDFIVQCEAMRQHREKLDGPHALDFLKVLA